MKIRFLGACQEVGRSAFAVSVGSKYLVMDYGVMVNHAVGFPMHIPPKDVEAIVLTHAHLDHVGAAPIFYIQGGVPMYGVQPTFTLSRLIIKVNVLVGYVVAAQFKKVLDDEAYRCMASSQHSPCHDSSSRTFLN